MIKVTKYTLVLILTKTFKICKKMLIHSVVLLHYFYVISKFVTWINIQCHLTIYLFILQPFLRKLYIRGTKKVPHK
jgi:hypothetical protein